MQQSAIQPEVVNAFYESSTDGALVINRLRRIMQINPGGTEITGWKRQDLTSVTCNVFSCRDEGGRKICEDQCLAQKCIEQSQTIGPLYLRINRADGRPVSTQATFLPIDPTAGVTLLVLKDISLLEHMDSQLRQANQTIAEKNIILKGFSDQMSVVWRAAMVDLRTGAEGLRAKYSKELGETGAKTLDRMVQATQKLETTFAQLKSQIQSTLSQRAAPGGQEQKKAG